MPIIETTNPWADAMLALAGEAQGYQGAKQQQFQNQLQTQQQKQQQLQQQAEQDYRDKQLRIQASEYGLDANGNPIPSNVKYDPPPTNPKPGDMAKWAASQLAKAVAANDVAGVSRFKDAALALSQTDVREEGQIPLDEARVAQIKDQVKNGFQQKFQLLMARLQGEQKLRAMAAYHRAGGGGGGSSEREAIALATAMNRAAGQEYSEANQNARDQYREALQFYEKTYNATSGQGYNLETGGMSAQPPQPIQVEVGGPTIYSVSGGGVQPVQNNRNTATPTTRMGTQQLAATFGAALQNGHTAQALRQQAASEGYSTKQINDAFLYLAAHKGQTASPDQGF